LQTCLTVAGLQQCDDDRLGTRPPRLALLPHEKAEVEAMMARALKNRPLLPNVGLKAA
jgi:hypothetical protein